MSTKIRLQRKGRKKRAFFQIVVADNRAPRDGRFIEKLGTYDPMTNPATINLDIDSATTWVLNGAQPTDTAASILRYKGVMYKKHLQVGVNKGSITQEQADAKFAAWVEEKEGRINAKRNRLAEAKNTAKSEALKRETAVKESIAAKIVAKNNPEMAEDVANEEVATAETSADEAIEAVTEDVASEEVAAVETSADEAIEAVTEEVASEEATEEAADEPATEAEEGDTEE